MKKQNITVLFGGKSAEREISILTGKQIVKFLDKSKYNVRGINIPKKGSWWVNELIKSKPDIAFLALHGPFGEDGTIQGMLEILDTPYTFSGVLASALAMDKFRVSQFVSNYGITIPKSFLANKKYNLNDIIKAIGFPCVVKPNGQGSSVGTSVNIKSKPALKNAIHKSLKYDNYVLIEEYIKGREITVPVLGNINAEALPIIEIFANIGAFYNYESKYSTGGSNHAIPAPIDETLTKEAQRYAQLVHVLIGARGVTRSDFILRNNTFYFLEINTIPGMTNTSLVPESAEYAGISFEKLLDKLIVLAKSK